MPNPPPPIEDQASIARGEDLYHLNVTCATELVPWEEVLLQT